MVKRSLAAAYACSFGLMVCPLLPVAAIPSTARLLCFACDGVVPASLGHVSSTTWSERRAQNYPFMRNSYARCGFAFGMYPLGASFPSRAHLGCGRPPSAGMTMRGGAEVHDAGNAETRDLRINVRGMRCGGCSNRVTKILRGAPGVKEAVVSLPSAMAIVKYAPHELIPTRLVDDLNSNGFTAEVWEDKDAVQRVAAQEEADRQEGQRLLRAVIAVSVISIPTILGPTSVLPSMAPVWGVPASTILELAQATLALCTAGVGILVSGWRAARSGYANMDVLVSLGVLASFAHSAAMLWLDPTHSMFQTVPTLLAIILFGRFLEFSARRATTAAITDIAALQPQRATLLVGEGDGAEELDVDVKVLQPGDVVRVVAGSIVPVDGEVAQGGALVDESMVTGEPSAVFKAPGAEVSAGTRVGGSGWLKVKARRTGAATAVSEMLELVQVAHAEKAPVSRLADAVAGVLVPTVLALAAAVVTGWWVAGAQGLVATDYFGGGLGPGSQALLFGIATVVVCCPCAMAIATPIAMVVGIGVGARNGVLFKSAGTLEAAAGLTHMCLDKTGTLTEGRARVVEWRSFSGSGGGAVEGARGEGGGGGEEGVWRAVAAAETQSEHPLAPVLGRFAREKGGGGAAGQEEAEEVKLVEGMGLVCRVGGRRVAVGSEELLARSGAEVAAAAKEEARGWERAGRTVVYVATEGAAREGMECRLAMAVADPVRAEAREVVCALQKAGLQVSMLSGDSQQTAEAVGRAVGISDVRARLTPAGKVEAIKALQAGGARVGMVGDGINDAAALAQAEVGMAMGAGSGPAVSSAPVVLSGLSRLLTATSLAKATLRRVQVSLLWAAGYNLVALPLAAGLLAAPLGLVASPCACASLMSASSLFVVLSALSLSLFRPPPLAHLQARGRLAASA